MLCLIGTVDQPATLLGAIVFALVWWSTRRHVVSLSSDGGSSLDFRVSGMSNVQIEDFTHQLSLAKLERIQQLNLLKSF